MHGNAVVAAALAALVTFVAQAAALTPADKCEAAKLKIAGKYGFCRLKAESKAVKIGAAPDYSLCDLKYGGKWGNAETTGGGQCPTNGDEAPIQVFIAQHTDDLAVALNGGPLANCPGDLATCTTGLNSCTATLGACNAGYATCTGDLATCNNDLTTAQNDLASCAGDLSNCSADLATCNSSYATCSSSLATVNAGTAAQADVLSGKTFSSGAGLGVSGAMTNVGQQNVTPGTTPIPIMQGYHNGSGAVAGDTDLIAANIKNGVSIFGVTGTAAAGTLRTGQVLCDQGNSTMGACPGSPSGQDGTTLKGTVRSYTNNGNGTVTDNSTGLMWEVIDDANANGSIHDKDAAYNWTNAFKKIQVLNGNAAGCIAANDPHTCCTGPGTGTCTPFAGHADWRLPNINELQSLVNYGLVSPSINSAFNSNCNPGCTVTGCSCTLTSNYWSSTSVQNNPLFAWIVFFVTGDVSAGNKTSTYYVRAVRGGS